MLPASARLGTLAIFHVFTDGKRGPSRNRSLLARKQVRRHQESPRRRPHLRSVCSYLLHSQNVAAPVAVAAWFWSPLPPLTPIAPSILPSRFSKSPCGHFASCHAVGAGARLSFMAIFTKCARESAFIFCITCPRCFFTVISLIPSSPPTCLFNRPDATSAITWRSRRERAW